MSWTRICSAVSGGLRSLQGLDRVQRSVCALSVQRSERATWLCGLLWVGLTTPISAAEPVLQGVRPFAWQAGQDATVSVLGLQLDPSRGLWTSAAVTSELVSSNPQQATYALRWPATMSLGVHAVRCWTDRGLSLPQLIWVDDLPTREDGSAVLNYGDPGEGLAGERSLSELWLRTRAVAHSVESAVCLWGVLPAQHARLYRLPLAAGQPLHVEVIAARLGAQWDPRLQLFDPQGRLVTASDDSPGLAGDCRFEAIIRDAGEYTLQLDGVRFGGGSYVLRISEWPASVTVNPLVVSLSAAAVQATAESAAHATIVSRDEIWPIDPAALPAEVFTLANETSPFGMARLGSSAGHLEARLQAAAAALPVWDQRLNVSAVVPQRAGRALGVLQLTRRPVLSEQEPNQDLPTATAIPDVGPAVDLCGVLQQRGDVDLFRFSAVTGERLRFTTVSRESGSTADVVLKLLNADGQVLATADDTGLRDAQLGFTAPATGEFTLSISEIIKRGGPSYPYRVQLDRGPRPFTLASSVDTLTVPAGGAAGFRVGVPRQDYAGPIELVAVGLPSGWTARPTRVGPNQAAGWFTVECPAHDEPGSSNLVATQTDAVDSQPQLSSFPPAPVRFQVLGHAVLPSAPPVDAASNANPTAAAAATDGGLAGYVAAAEVDGVWQARSPTLPFTPRTVQPGIEALADRSPEIALSAPADLQVVIGGAATLPIRVQRSAGWNEPVELAWGLPQNEALPPHVTVELKPIAADTQTIELTVTAAAAASPEVWTLGLVGTIKHGDVSVRSAVPSIRLSVITPPPAPPAPTEPAAAPAVPENTP